MGFKHTYQTGHVCESCRNQICRKRCPKRVLLQLALFCVHEESSQQLCLLLSFGRLSSDKAMEMRSSLKKFRFPLKIRVIICSHLSRHQGRLWRNTRRDTVPQSLDQSRVARSPQLSREAGHPGSFHCIYLCFLPVFD